MMFLLYFKFLCSGSWLIGCSACYQMIMGQCTRVLLRFQFVLRLSQYKDSTCERDWEHYGCNLNFFGKTAISINTQSFFLFSSSFLFFFWIIAFHPAFAIRWKTFHSQSFWEFCVFEKLHPLRKKSNFWFMLLSLHSCETWVIIPNFRLMMKTCFICLVNN